MEMDSQALNCMVIMDDRATTCGNQATAIVTTGCVHEHISNDAMCDLCQSDSTGLYCTECGLDEVDDEYRHIYCPVSVIEINYLKSSILEGVS